MGILDFFTRGARTKEDYFTAGCRLARKGRLEKAIGNWRAVTRMDPAHARAHFNLGLAYFTKDPVGLRDEAVREWKLASSINPTDVDIQYTHSLATGGNDTEALKAWVEEKWNEALGRTTGRAGARENPDTRPE